YMPAHINWRTFISTHLLPRGHILTNKIRDCISTVTSRIGEFQQTILRVKTSACLFRGGGATWDSSLSSIPKLGGLTEFYRTTRLFCHPKGFYNRPCMHAHYTIDQNWWALIDLNYRNAWYPVYTRAGLSASLKAHKLGGCYRIRTYSADATVLQTAPTLQLDRKS